jgi:N-succinyl-L-ornithine transcarbamylase
MNRTNNAFFMHCLPIRRNVVAADGVLDDDKSLVIEQANNRTYATQAVLHQLLSHG